MPALLKPLSCHVPTPPFGHRVAGPPNSLLSADQRKAAKKDPLSFRNAVGRGAGASHADAVAWVDESVQQGALRPLHDSVVIYRQSNGVHAVTGLIADVSIDAYDSGRIKPHERTIAKTERRMANYMRTTRIYGNPVALTYRPHQTINATIAAIATGEAAASFSTPDSIRHEMWFVRGGDAADLCRSFNEVVYITDGHHRMAAASQVAAEEGWSDGRIPAGLFPSNELTMRSFARCITDSDLDVDNILARFRSDFLLEDVDEAGARPRRRGEFGVRVRDRFFRLQLDRPIDGNSVYESLDVNLLQELILGPIFGISDRKRDGRVRFVADLSEIHPADTDADVWILPFPIDVNDVMAVADAGQAMPPKSTWLAPKVPSGLVIRI